MKWTTDIINNFFADFIRNFTKIRGFERIIERCFFKSSNLLDIATDFLHRIFFLRPSSPPKWATDSFPRSFIFIFPALWHVVLLHTGKLIFATFFAAQRFFRHLCIKAGRFLCIYFSMSFSQKWHFWRPMPGGTHRGVPTAPGSFLKKRKKKKKKGENTSNNLAQTCALGDFFLLLFGRGYAHSTKDNLGDLYMESGQTLHGSFSAVSESESEVVRFSKRKKT